MLPAITFAIQLISLYFLSTFIFKKSSYLLLKLFRSQRVMMYILALLFLPGTIIHELSHWAVATILFVPTGKITLWPEFLDNGIKMGSVQIAKTDIIRRTLIGVAPVLIGISVILSSLYLVIENNLLDNQVILIATAILIFQIGNTMFSSKKDLEGSGLFFIFLLAIIIGLYFLGVEININLTPILLPATKLLLIPIGIDLLLVLILKII